MMAAGSQMKVHGHGASGLHEFPADSSTAATALEVGDGGSARWPRQETLTLLEIRSRLDSRFREANQKGPLWDEVSRYSAHSKTLFFHLYHFLPSPLSPSVFPFSFDLILSSECFLTQLSIRISYNTRLTLWKHDKVSN